MTDTRLAPDWFTRVNIAASTLTSTSGVTMRYSLESARRWNIGRRRHVMELTGEIRVHSPDGISSRCADGWAAAFNLADDYASRLPVTPPA